MGPPTEHTLKIQSKFVHLDREATNLSLQLIEKEKDNDSKDKTIEKQNRKISQLENEIFQLKAKLQVMKFFFFWSKILFVKEHFSLRY